VTDEPSDEALAAQLATGDTGAFERLYGRYGSRIHGWAWHVVGADRADDALQEVFIRVWRSREQFDPARGRFTSWLMAIARHHLGREAARRGRERRLSITSAIDQALESVPDPEPAADERLSADERHRRILEALRLLPAEQRQNIVLAYFLGMSQSEMAEHLAIPLGTVKKRTRLGMQKLRRALDDGSLETPHLRVVDE
jgi:RNA polymerase sigma factor (sigma-70 family)